MNEDLCPYRLRLAAGSAFAIVDRTRKIVFRISIVVLTVYLLEEVVSWLEETRNRLDKVIDAADPHACA